ncbi:MAG: MarR family transcriptional regulator [Tepidisphaeraceae bacterium]
MSLGSEIKKKRPFDLLEAEAMLNVLRTGDVLQAEFAGVFKPFELSETQYNVLRILRGAANETGGGLPCGEIASRMITRDPDITRLLDRLEKRGVISRCREQNDRRVVCARITESGRKILADLDPLIVAAHKQQLGHLSREELNHLITLLEKARERKQQS